MKRVFQPFASATPKHARIVLVSWVVLLVLVWTAQPLPVIPSPLQVGLSFLNLFTGNDPRIPVIIPDLVASLKLNFEAIAISTAFSLTLAYTVSIPALRPMAEGSTKLRYLGLTGLTFLFGLLLSGHSQKLALLVFGMSTFYVTSMVSVIREIPLDDIRHARSLRMGPWRAWYEVVVLGTADAAIETLRQNAAIGLIMLTTVEALVQSEGGLGVALRNVNRSFRMEDVFALQFLILLLGLGQDMLFGWLKDLVCPYATNGD